MNDSGVVNLDENDIRLEEISPPDHILRPTFKCFKIDVPYGRKEEFFESSVWPSNSFVTPYRHKPAMQGNHAD